MVLLRIVSVPTDAHGETNCVFFNPVDNVQPTHVDINGMLFSARPDGTVQPGTLAMNLLQRRCTKVSTAANDSVDVPPAGHPAPDATVVAMELRIEYVNATKRGGELDYTALNTLISTVYKGQFFQLGQQLLVVNGGNKYIATVTNFEGMSKGGSAASIAQFQEATQLRLTVLEKCEMQLVNVPDAVEDAQQPSLINSFDLEKLGIGGLRAEFGQVFRRAFASRIFPQSVVKRLEMPHVKGVLLHGPPGTGKTLIARKIGQILNCRPPKIVHGPEVFSKFVGQAEENVRKLFAEAEADQAAKGDKSPLHLIIFDEFDAICKQRGATRDGTGVNDNVVNQLLSKIDGVNPLNNVLLVGMTNRKDLIDEAILRPGRFELHVEIGLPDEEGRHQILGIHTRRMKEQELLHADVDLKRLAGETKNFSGAEIEGLVRSAQSHAFSRHIDFENPTEVTDVEHLKIQMSDFNLALNEVTPAFGRAEEECNTALRNGIIAHGPKWKALQQQVDSDLASLKKSPKLDALTLLLIGGAGTGKSAAAASFAMASEFPYVKVISSNNMVGYGEMQKSNIIRKAFEDAYKSKLSVVVLDDLERLVEYSALGGRYSNTLLQTILVLVKRPPPEGRKVLVIATASSRDVVEALDLADAFAVSAGLPLVQGEGLLAVTEGLGVTWASESDKQRAVSALPVSVPIKKLIFIVEKVANVLPDGRRILSYDRFVESVTSLAL